MFLIFDTETTGLPRKNDAPLTDFDNWPRVVQIAWQLHDQFGKLIEHECIIIKPNNFDIPFKAQAIHGISNEYASAIGKDFESMAIAFKKVLSKTKYFVGHFINFDIQILSSEFLRQRNENPLENIPRLDTCTELTANLCKIKKGRGGRFKLPTLIELYQHLFDTSFQEAHNASADVEATARCFMELLRTEQVFEDPFLKSDTFITAFLEANPDPIPLIGLKHENLKEESKKYEQLKPQERTFADDNIKQEFLKAPFVHLHNHTEFSVLQSTTKIPKLIKTTAKLNMNAVAITDIGNMMGAFLFQKEVEKYNTSLDETQTPIKAIIGCELYVNENHLDKSIRDDGYKIVFLAKNEIGYRNLSVMSSIGYTKGFYYVPRIDKNIVEQYSEGLIALTGNLYGEVPAKILNVGLKQAENALLWWKNVFQEDLYIELIDHGLEIEQNLKYQLSSFSKTHDIKTIATNDTYYLEQENASSHDVLLCIKDNQKLSAKKSKGKGFRSGFENQEYFFKDTETMKTIFAQFPESIINIQKLVDKITSFKLEKPVLLPTYDIPKAFAQAESIVAEYNYLKHLTYEGAKIRYSELTDSIRERIDFELDIIKKTGYPGYFLIVYDLIKKSREMGVSVGPGRGSAAGSVVAYCLNIINIDPIKYDLLFERFLNPERISLPDIDIDFEDEGRAKVLQYIIDKYGKDQVAQIITYGTMGARSAIRDTARILDLSLEQADYLAKLVPWSVKLKDILDNDDEYIKVKYKKAKADDIDKIMMLRQLASRNDLQAQTLNQAKILEGSIRNIGTHACGVIISPEKITNLVPITVNKDAELYITQFDNLIVEQAGLLKMDILGLKTLTLIKESVELIRTHRKINIDIENISLEDKKTFELFQKGETTGIFQYESPGMQKVMRELKPNIFEDLIAINALFRPGPMDSIPLFIRRKHKKEKIVLDLEVSRDILKETYGITVYQEQVMLLSQKISNFTKGQADTLRKAMGKKDKELLHKLKPLFIKGGTANNHEVKVLEKIWTDWETFADYAFNKSHATCYAWLGYQTAYLKANYPEEYMATVLSNNQDNIDQITFFLEECKRMKIKVLGPDINESGYRFTVNKNDHIRFGLAAIKGLGRPSVETIIKNRKDKPYTSIFDLCKRVDLKNINKRTLENLVYSGSFDSFVDVHRAQYFYCSSENETSIIEKALKFASSYQIDKKTYSRNLFDDNLEAQISEPKIPLCDPWNTLTELRTESHVLGLFLSGHPLDDFKIEIEKYCNTDLSQLFIKTRRTESVEHKFAGVVCNAEHRTSKNGKKWATFTVEDYKKSVEFKIFGEKYLKYKHLLEQGQYLYFKIKLSQNTLNESNKIENDYFINFNKIELLQDVLKEYSKRLYIIMDIEQVKKKTTDKICDLIKKNKGKKAIYILVRDRNEKIEINFKNSKQSIDINTNLLAAFRNLKLNYMIK